MKNQTLTITDEQGNSMTIDGFTLNNMIVKQVKMYNNMIEKKHNNPHLTKEELVEGVKELIEKREKVESLLGITYK